MENKKILINGKEHEGDLSSKKEEVNSDDISNLQAFIYSVLSLFAIALIILAFATGVYKEIPLLNEIINVVAGLTSFLVSFIHPFISPFI